MKPLINLLLLMSALMSGRAYAGLPNNPQILPVPAVGTVIEGYRFQGGDPSEMKNWKPIKNTNTPKNNTNKFTAIQKLAKQGNADAQYKLGVMYSEGKGIPKDDSKAVYWYRKAAKQGDA